MPSEVVHRDQARRNLQHAEWLVANALNDPTARQWALIAAFYCAVHCIELHLAKVNQHSFDHTDRLDRMALKSTGVPVTVFIAYKRLKEHSERVRYDAHGVSEKTLLALILVQTLPVITKFVSL